MRFQAPASTLADAVGAASRAVRGRSSVPILECLMVIADDGRLSFVGTDMDSEVCATCPDASVSSVGSCCVSARLLKDFLGHVGGLVSVSLANNILTISTGRSRIDLPTMDAGAFPRFDVGEAPHEVSAEAFSFCLPFCGTEEAKYFLMGVNFSPSGACGTNGHRLAYDREATAPISATIPTGAAPLVAAIKGARLFVGGATWRAEGENIRVAGRLLGGDYPDWPRLAIHGPKVAEIHADGLHDAVATAMVGCDDKSNALMISGADEEIVVRAERGVRVDASCDAEVFVPFGGCMNGRYLLSALKALSGKALEATAADAVVHLCVAGDAGRGIFIYGIRSAEDNWPKSSVKAGAA